MDKSVSNYLDLTRFVAAMVVFLAHATYARYTSIFANALPFGHDAVIVFFVLSGYVIAYVTAGRDRTALDYGISRAARIYSVVIPAIALTILLDAMRMRIDPAFHEYEFGHLWYYVPYWLAFGTDWWFLNESMLSNAPFWSLSYEVWYYVIFGAMFYFRGWKRWLLALLALLIVGPRQWLLFPIWLVGCALYYRHERWHLNAVLARFLFFGSIALYLLLKLSHTFDTVDALVNGALGGIPKQYLRYSQSFVCDYVIAILVVVNIYSVRYCNFRMLAGTLRPVTFAASFTFSLYLFHYPLIEFYSALFHTNPASLMDYGQLLAAVLVSVFLLGLVTERKKGLLKRALRSVANLALKRGAEAT